MNKYLTIDRVSFQFLTAKALPRELPLVGVKTKANFPQILIKSLIK